jgi:hypothetical protein
MRSLCSHHSTFVITQKDLFRKVKGIMSIEVGDLVVNFSDWELLSVSRGMLTSTSWMNPVPILMLNSACLLQKQ